MYISLEYLQVSNFISHSEGVRLRNASQHIKTYICYIFLLNMYIDATQVKHQRSFWVWAQPMRNFVKLLCGVVSRCLSTHPEWSLNMFPWQACLSVAFTQMIEMFDSKRRAIVGIGLEYLWVLGFFYVAGMGYFVRNWRHLQLILSLTAATGLINIV